MAYRWTAADLRNRGVPVHRLAAWPPAGIPWRERAGEVLAAVRDLWEDIGFYCDVLAATEPTQHAAACGGRCLEDFEEHLALHRCDLLRAAGRLAHPAADQGVFEDACRRIARSAGALQELVQAAYGPCPQHPCRVNHCRTRAENRRERRRLERISTECLEADALLGSIANVLDQLPGLSAGPRERSWPRQALTDTLNALEAIEEADATTEPEEPEAGQGGDDPDTESS